MIDRFEISIVLPESENEASAYVKIMYWDDFNNTGSPAYTFELDSGRYGIYVDQYRDHDGNMKQNRRVYVLYDINSIHWLKAVCERSKIYTWPKHRQKDAEGIMASPSDSFEFYYKETEKGTGRRFTDALSTCSMDSNFKDILGMIMNMLPQSEDDVRDIFKKAYFLVSFGKC